MPEDEASAGFPGALAQVWHREAPHVLGALLRRHPSLADCEDAAQEALIAASAQWPAAGMPHDPRGWLIRVAGRRLVDQWRSEQARHHREQADARLDLKDRAHSCPADLAVDGCPGGAVDDSVELLLLCCHPALTLGSQVALMARAVAGLSTAQVAAGFLVPQATMAQRISRAKATIVERGARFPVPDPAERVARLVAVRHAIALLHTEGHTRSAGRAVTDPGFAAEALLLARRLSTAAPEDPENAGLLALLLLTGARAPARTDATGDLVPLEYQDRTRWDQAAITEGVALLEAVLPVGPLGPFQLQAAIAAVHDEAPTWAETDWPQIAELYRILDTIAPGEAVTLGRATATAMVQGADAGLALLAPLANAAVQRRNHRYHAVRGHLLVVAGRTPEALSALGTAARMTRSIPEQRYLNRVIARLQVENGQQARHPSSTEGVGNQ